MESKTFCILPWIHMYANADGSVVPCCVGRADKTQGNVQKNSVQKIWNGDSFKIIRKSLSQRAGRCDRIRSRDFIKIFPELENFWRLS